MAMQEAFDNEYNPFHHIMNENQDSNPQYEQMSFQPLAIEIKDFDQLINQNQMPHTQQLTNNQENDQSRVDYKNLPKLIGNHFYKYIEQNNITKTKGVQNFCNQRQKKEKGTKTEKQLSTKISDLREVCKADPQSKTNFKRFIKKQLFIDLIHSSKIEDPLKYIDGISTYYATADEPDKMISSHIISSKKTKKS
ncbi:unnamed protein product (macronuclear) [Paramecium tetraurelia]|uniref:Uncharacterized protein n=1 Tax=Paramecium tetraurelia TaxID=5888 RepID=A0EBN7_PARTE|nr:uncharacterized protein GSPATT00025438001 [Paramecium tetraurelia]CAK92704.1 unnamed protein product [Paramecium tetraurelia]|eukprot:XP_001460101.1 hypothetical protein (macronuclear) [Paramecium tetraurelia strain d4-2]